MKEEKRISPPADLDSRIQEAVNKLAAGYCSKILYVDLTADTFRILYADDSISNAGPQTADSVRLSDYFAAFAESRHCHDNDRERFKKFTAFSSLKAALDGSGGKSVSFVFRAKYNLSDIVYSTMLLELSPFESDDGHVTAILLIRNITEDITQYNISLDEEARLQVSAAGRKTLLIVEDNEMNREMLEAILDDDYNVLQAENGAAGLELLQKHMMDVSVVILDVQMPVMNGYEFLEITQSDPFLSKIPVIVATGSNNAEEERICLRLGASDFVAKPYNPDIIKSRIANIIRLKESAATMSILQTDDRTGLYTLQAFYYHVGLAITKLSGKHFSIIIFDINHFKDINENYGEDEGDRVLRQIADCIKGYTAASDINGRFGAARFLLLREKVPGEKTEDWIGGLFDTMKNACSVKGISFRAGIYDDVDPSLPVSIICDRAIAALNTIGNTFDKWYAVFDEKQAEKERRLAVLESDMRDAYDREEFSVYYQPKHDVRTGKLMGAEALIRWIHPKFGFLSPGEFIPLFEKNGFVSYADYYVLKRTCHNLRVWQDEGITPVPISVNSSRKDFDRDNYLERMEAPLKQNGIDPSLIHIEVTESLFSDRMDEIAEILSQCRADGFRIELDDFGSGYSSLTTLSVLPLDVMKLDMSFMKDYRNEKKLKVLSTCIGLAKSLGLTTVCEGVENAEQRALLLDYGCDLIQGYYFSKPIPEKEFRDYLIKYSER